MSTFSSVATTPPPPSLPEAATPSASFFYVRLSKAMSPDMLRMTEDLVRMFIIQITIQFLLYMTDSKSYAFFTPEFIVLLIYILVAIMIYWLIFKKVVQFV